jgi:hypothetical protein
MPKGIHNTPRGRKKDPNKMVGKTMKLPSEVWANTTPKERREAILIMFQNKIK